MLCTRLTEDAEMRRVTGGHSVVRRLAALTALAFAALLPIAGPAAAAPPQWKLTVTPLATYFPPAPDENAIYTIEAENLGGTTSLSQQIVLEDVLPPGLAPFGAGPEAVKLFASPTGLQAEQSQDDLALKGLCPTSLRCEYPGPLSLPAIKKGEKLVMQVRAAIRADFPTGQIEDQASVSGGGGSKVEATATNAVEAEPPYGLGFEARLLDPSRQAPFTQAGGQPYQFSTEFNPATIAQRANQDQTWGVSSDAPVRDPFSLIADLPPGLTANPQAVPHCALAAYFANECEPSTIVGFVGFRGFDFAMGGFQEMVPLFNLQPQGGFPGLLGYVVGGGQDFLITTGLRSGGDYGVTAAGTGLLPIGINRVRVTVWGVPADHSHDTIRGKVCSEGSAKRAWDKNFANSPDQNERDCESSEGNQGPIPGGGAAGVPPTPFLIMPTECSGTPLTVGARSTSWQLPADEVSASSTLPLPVDGCSALSFEPTIQSRPTTNLADAPSGLEFHLHLPQHEACTESGGVASCELATPSLHEAVVRLPAGLTVNPSSANGLAACSPAQIGLKTALGQTPAHFSEEPAHCPAAAKIGLAEVKTPLLHEPLGAVEPLPGRVGDVYLATPHQNPFNSLLAAYIVLEGEGLIIKLPGRIETDSQTGQITGRFLENPQTPFEDFRLKFFEGAQGDLRTPAVCGSYATTSVLTPYSAPESGPPAEPSAEFETTAGPTGGACPNSAAAEPNKPVFHAGTESPQAATYSPFSLKLVREDGSQEIKAIDTTLPPGLTGKLAGVAECSDAQLAAASQRSGVAEKASPSCPLSSEVGTVDVASGAGPTPLNVGGHAYLAGPYKGAPLSLAIITPAVAGPFDLGDVVVRTALFVNPETAQIHAVSDPIPTILEGIPLDVRSITVKMGRPNFTLNPTNCEPLGFTGSALSVFGGSAPLSQRFQVGGCSVLPFRPKLAIKLKGGTKRHTFPALSATLTMPPGNANIASAQVTLPRSAFLEQSHIKTVCTRPQLASHTCPPASIYGYAKAISPLLDKPLEGPVYLGVGYGYKLPALVADLNGQIEVLLHGKVDTGKENGLRNSFEVVPDAPVSKFTLSMFGGKKGLIVNSENLCGPNAKVKALATFTGQNGKVSGSEPTVANSCKGKGRKHHKKHRHGKR